MKTSERLTFMEPGVFTAYVAGDSSVLIAPSHVKATINTFQSRKRICQLHRTKGTASYMHMLATAFSSLKKASETSLGHGT